MEQNPKIIYIMGCGRSGTTLVSILLGNNKNMVNLGEVVDYAKFQGKPNGFDPNTENYLFWEKVGKQYFSNNAKISYEGIDRLTQDIEYHKGFLFTFFNWHSQNKKQAYRRHINALIDSILGAAKGSIVVDSSKYPGRAAALIRYLQDKDVYIIYVVRDPRGVVDSFRKEEVDQKSKGFWSAVVYYFIINLFCNLVRLKVDKDKFIKVNYEQFIKNPETELRRIQQMFRLDLEESISMVKNNQPLDPGFILNGNRMRLGGDIKLVKKEEKFENNLRNRLIQLVNGSWY